MKVVEVIGPGQLRLADRQMPRGDGDAVVTVDRVGICGTDVKILSGDIPVAYPRVMGHEMVGTVLQPGRGDLVSVGQRVLIDPAITCGYCDQCRRGRLNTCRNGGLMGRDSEGVFAEQVAVSSHRLHVIPDHVTDEAAALLQVLGTVVHAQYQAAVSPEMTAVVVGLGVSGLLHLQLLLARGLYKVIGVTRSDWKLELADRFGATATAVPAEAPDVVAEVTDGRGADLVIEAAGTERTLRQSIELAGLGATIVVFGTTTKGSEGLPYYQLYLKELTLLNPRAANPHDYDVAIRLTADGRLDPASLLTHTLPFEQAEAAFEATGSADSLKVTLVPEAAQGRTS